MNFIQSQAYLQYNRILDGLEDESIVRHSNRTFDENTNTDCKSSSTILPDASSSNSCEAVNAWSWAGQSNKRSTEPLVTHKCVLPKMVTKEREIQKASEYSVPHVSNTIGAPLYFGPSADAQRSNCFSAINNNNKCFNRRDTFQNDNGIYRNLVADARRELLDRTKHIPNYEYIICHQKSAQRDPSKEFIPVAPPGSCLDRQRRIYTSYDGVTASSNHKLKDLLMSEQQIRGCILDNESFEANVILRVINVNLHEVIIPQFLVLEQKERTIRSQTFSQERKEREHIRVMERSELLTASNTENVTNPCHLSNNGQTSEGVIVERLIKEMKTRQELVNTELESFQVNVNKKTAVLQEERFSNRGRQCIRHNIYPIASLNQSQYEELSNQQVHSRETLIPIPPRRSTDTDDKIQTVPTQLQVRENGEFIFFEIVRPILLLESQERKLIVEQQERFFVEWFVEYFSEELKKSQKLMERANHLERLKYWRKQREMKEKTTEFCLEYEQKANIFEVLQTTEREEIEKTQYTEFDIIQNSYIVETMALELKCLEDVECRIRRDIFTSWLCCTSDFLIYLERFEELQRCYLTSVVAVEMVQEPLHGQAIIIADLLLHFQRVVSSVVKIQRCFKKQRIGIIGWRRTHKNIGVIILNMRSKRTSREAYNPINALRNNLHDTVCQMDDESCCNYEKQFARLEAEEDNVRVSKIEDGENWYRNRLVSSKIGDMVFEVFLPMRRRLEFSQEPARRSVIRDAIFGREGLWGALKLRFDKVCRLLERKRRLDLVLAPECRYLVEVDEANALSRLRVEFIDGGNRVDERQREHEIMQLNSRELLLRREELHREEIRKNNSDTAVALVNNLQREIMGCIAVNIGYVNHVIIPYLTETLGLFQKCAFDLHTAVGSDLLFQHTSCLNRIIMLSIYDHHEPFNRCGILMEEEHNRNAIQRFFSSHLSVIVRRQWNIQRAAIRIQRFVRDVKKGELVTQSGMRVYLSQRMLQKRERIALCKHMEMQREDLDRVRQQLYEEIRKHVMETANEFIPFFERLATLEQRCRQRIDDDAMFLKNLVYTNHRTLTDELIRSQIENCSAHESYWRYRLEEEFYSPFDEPTTGRDPTTMRGAFVLKKRTFAEDVKIRAGQRAWRCYVARQTRKKRVLTCLNDIQLIEATNRYPIEKDCLCERALGHITGTTLLREYVSFTMVKLFNYQCFELELKQGIYANESHARLMIIEMLEGAQRYSHIEKEERETRAVLYNHTWMHLLGEVELVETEAYYRKTIIREYYLFLMNCMISFEARSRVAFIMEGVLSFQRDEMIFRNEELMRCGIIMTQLHQRSEMLLREGLDARARHAVEEGNCRGKLITEAEESLNRIIVEDRRTSHYTFFINLLVYKESTERSMLNVHEECEARWNIIYPTQEAVRRELILKRWGSTGPYYERDAVFDLVEGDL